jgi:hypothetical protein
MAEARRLDTRRQILRVTMAAARRSPSQANWSQVMGGSRKTQSLRGNS